MSGSNPITPESILDRMVRDREELDRIEAVLKEEEADYRAALNRLASSPDGQYFFNKMIRYCGINTFDKVLNPAKLVENEGKRKVFLELVRPYLNKEILNELDR